MSKNLNLKVEENVFYEFHRLKSLLRAGTNQDALQKLLVIADEKIKELNSRNERDQFIKRLDEKNKVLNTSV